jgi:hypothetical protein
MSVDFHQATWHYIPEDRTLRNCPKFVLDVSHNTGQMPQLANFWPDLICQVLGKYSLANKSPNEEDHPLRLRDLHFTQPVVPAEEHKGGEKVWHV